MRTLGLGWPLAEQVAMREREEPKAGTKDEKSIDVAVHRTSQLPSRRGDGALTLARHAQRLQALTAIVTLKLHPLCNYFWTPWGFWNSYPPVLPLTFYVVRNTMYM